MSRKMIFMTKGTAGEEAGSRLFVPPPQGSVISVYARLRRAMALAERCAAEPGSRLLATRRNRGPGSAKRHEECRIAPGTRIGPHRLLRIGMVMSSVLSSRTGPLT